MKHGIVTSTQVSNTGHLAITVQSSRAGVTWDNVIVGQDQPGSVQNIEEGWHVALDKCDDGLWIVLKVLNTEPDLLPNDLKGFERSLKLDDGTEISARKNEDGDYDVTISASGDVYIGEKDDAEKLAKQDHTHDYSWSKAAGSGTTSKPNESGTETQVQ